MVNLAGIAREAGIVNSFEFDDIDQLAAELPGLLTMTGPVFVDLKVVKGDDYEYRWDVVHGPESREIFREAMSNS